MKTRLHFAAFFLALGMNAQVGVGTATPNAQLDVRATNQATPASTDGLLIPKVDAFPATNPGAPQQGMLVYLTTAAGPDAPGFYYWDFPTLDWIGLTAAIKSTVAQPIPWWNFPCPAAKSFAPKPTQGAAPRLPKLANKSRFCTTPTNLNIWNY